MFARGQQVFGLSGDLSFLTGKEQEGVSAPEHLNVACSLGLVMSEGATGPWRNAGMETGARFTSFFEVSRWRLRHIGRRCLLYRSTLGGIEEGGQRFKWRGRTTIPHHA